MIKKSDLLIVEKETPKLSEQDNWDTFLLKVSELYLETEHY